MCVPGTGSSLLGSRDPRTSAQASRDRRQIPDGSCHAGADLRPGYAHPPVSPGNIHPDRRPQTTQIAAQHPWITGIFLPSDEHSPEMREALEVSDELIAELFSADEILIGTPMYNFTVPANLKAWIDLVVRPRTTHSGPPERKGLVTGKTCKIIIASGGMYDEGLPAAASDYESAYLRRILAFIGLTDVEIILAGGTAAVSFGSTTIEELVAKYRPAVLAAIR